MTLAAVRRWAKARKYVDALPADIAIVSAAGIAGGSSVSATPSRISDVRYRVAVARP